jgi:hypothetical protein
VFFLAERDAHVVLAHPVSPLTGCGRALFEFPRHPPWPNRRRELYLRDTLGLPARGLAPLHTPYFSSLLRRRRMVEGELFPKPEYGDHYASNGNGSPKCDGNQPHFEVGEVFLSCVVA